MGFKVNISQILCVCAIFLFASPCHTRLADSQSFEVRLYSELVKGTTQENIIYSPLSIKTCLAMTRMGAVGQTALEMDKTLALSAQDRTNLAYSYHNILEKYQNSPFIRIANKIYIMKGYKIQAKFYNVTTQQFFAEIAGVNFAHSYASARAINKWVENKTNNVIKDLVSPDQLDGDTHLLLVNAIHFKGEWASKFDVKKTYDALFYLNDNSTFDVKMMKQKGSFKYGFIEELRAEFLEMPYDRSNLSMLIVLPSSRTGLPHVEKNLNTISLNYITSRMYTSEVEVHMPRFKSEFKANLNQPLYNMGMRRMFSSAAEFGKMLKSIDRLEVSSIIHKAVIEVNEDGTEAAAATVVELVNYFGGDDPVFIIDKPFYYVIKDENNLKIFEGRINSEFTA